MKPALSVKMVAKAQAAMTSAVEVYNRPSFMYREETFAILALNAWELLLKAKVVNEGGNKQRAIWAFEYKTLKSGKKSTKLSAKPHRKPDDDRDQGLYLEAHRLWKATGLRYRRQPR